MRVTTATTVGSLRSSVVSVVKLKPFHALLGLYVTVFRILSDRETERAKEREKEREREGGREGDRDTDMLQPKMPVLCVIADRCACWMERL